MAQNKAKREAKRKAKKKRLRVLKSRPARPRACGDCMECCRVFPVRGLPGYESFPNGVKPADDACMHIVSTEGARCGIYNDPKKPPVCGKYKCLWLHEGASKKRTVYHEERPDQLGIIFDLAGSDHPAVQALNKPVVVARPCWDEALDSPEAEEVFGRFMARGLVIAMVRGPGDYKFLAADPRDAQTVAKVYKDLPKFKVVNE